MAELLISGGADVKAASKAKAGMGETALHWACKREDRRLAAALKAAGASSKALDDNGCPPSAWGRASDFEMMQILGLAPELERRRQEQEEEERRFQAVLADAAAPDEEEEVVDEYAVYLARMRAIEEEIEQSAAKVARRAAAAAAAAAEAEEAERAGGGGGGRGAGGKGAGRGAGGGSAGPATDAGGGGDRGKAATRFRADALRLKDQRPPSPRVRRPAARQQASKF